MKRNKTQHRNTDLPLGGRRLTVPSVLLVLSLGLGSMVSSGCVAVPAVMMTSAAVTASAMVSEGEKIVQNTDTQNSSMVRNETYGDLGRGKACKREGALLETDRPGAHARQEMMNRCAAGLHQPEEVGEANLPKT